MNEPRRVLYRCGTPTNFLCPCGAVARRLKKRGLEYRTERVRQLVADTERVRRRRSNRPEIAELTKLPHVPVLVDGDEVVNDSRRILQYLDWRYGEESTPAASSASSGSQ